VHNTGTKKGSIMK